MKVGIIVFPGTNCDRDTYKAFNNMSGVKVKYVWHTFSDLLNYDLVVLPGGFSYGDYLRSGALARFSPVMSEIERYVLSQKGYVLGICNGFQILTEAGLLPGALSRNVNNRFICDYSNIEVVNMNTPFTVKCEKKILHLPIAHSDGNYRADVSTISELEKKNRIVFRYVNNPNGSINSIAGITDDNFRVLGMMPHPERNCDRILGNGDGRYILKSIAATVKSYPKRNMNESYKEGE